MEVDGHMPNLSEYNEYKKILVNAIINDITCVNLITNTTGTELPAFSLIDDEYTINQIHLYDYIPETTTEKKTHVCIEVLDGTTFTQNVSGFYIQIDVIVPEALMVMRGEIRLDSLASAIDTLICGNTSYGFGCVQRKNGEVGVPIDGFRGRTLRYYVQGWNYEGTK